MQHNTLIFGINLYFDPTKLGSHDLPTEGVKQNSVFIFFFKISPDYFDLTKQKKGVFDPIPTINPK